MKLANANAVAVAVIVVLIFCALSINAQEASFNKPTAHVGDIIEYKVKVELAKDAYINARQTIVFNNFDIKKYDINHLSMQPNVYEIVFEISAYKIGDLTLEPKAIFYLNADGTNNLFFTPQTSFQISPMVADSNPNIKDLKPLKKIPIKIIFVVLIVLLIAAIVALAFVCYKEISKIINKPIPVDPLIKALADLDELYNLDVKQKDSRFFYYAMSEILRSYISVKHNINTLEMTSTEFFEVLKTILPAEIDIVQIKQYLKSFNLARYADLVPDSAENEKNYNLTKMLLEKI
jgi:hypothetical protein